MDSSAPCLEMLPPELILKILQDASNPLESFDLARSSPVLYSVWKTFNIENFWEGKVLKHEFRRVLVPEVKFNLFRDLSYFIPVRGADPSFTTIVKECMQAKADLESRGDKIITPEECKKKRVILGKTKELLRLVGVSKFTVSTEVFEPRWSAPVEIWNHVPSDDIIEEAVEALEEESEQPAQPAQPEQPEEEANDDPDMDSNITGYLLLGPPGSKSRYNQEYRTICSSLNGYVRFVWINLIYHHEMMWLYHRYGTRLDPLLDGKGYFRDEENIPEWITMNWTRRLFELDFGSFRPDGEQSREDSDDDTSTSGESEDSEEGYVGSDEDF